jgi:ATP-dependent Clp protease ATP-binding subunit ClpB
MRKLAILDPTKMGRQAQDLENKLRHLVIGEHEAVSQIGHAYQAYLAGLSLGGRPIGNLLFFPEPTGSGNTRIVEKTADCQLTNPRAVIKIDCAAFQHSHQIARSIGSPLGYFGYRETHALRSSNLMATGQIHPGDHIRITHHDVSPFLTFFREGASLEAWGGTGRATA